MRGWGESALAEPAATAAPPDAPKSPAVGVPAACMDAALKRSRSEEPAELPPSARDLEEEEEEGMEQGLEEEEEVDPRIQVGRAGGAAGVGIYTRFAAPGA